LQFDGAGGVAGFAEAGSATLTSLDLI